MLTTDEEKDIGEYVRYLRNQSEDDLCDIACHIDPEVFPRRSEAVHREVVRRRLLLGPAFSRPENWIRYSCMWVVALTALALLLACTMSELEATAPQPPPNVGITAYIEGSAQVLGSNINAITLAQGFWQVIQNAIRFVVFWCASSGLYLLALAFSVWQLALLAVRRLRRRVTTPGVAAVVWAAALCQPLIALAAVFTNLAVLAANHHAPAADPCLRAITMFDPWR